MCGGHNSDHLASESRQSLQAESSRLLAERVEAKDRWGGLMASATLREVHFLTQAPTATTCNQVKEPSP